jgi:hypothetical protein
MFLAWERLRIIDSVVLIAETLLIAGSRVANPRFWESLVGGAIVASVCFCAGLFAECDSQLMGTRRRPARMLFFLLGTSFAMLLTAIALLGFTGQAFD